MQKNRPVQSNWEEIPFGRVEVKNQSLMILQIDPGKNSALGKKASDIDKNGLRGHPGILQEQIKVLSGEPDSLKYTGRSEHGDIVTVKYFGPGAVFNSVEEDGRGYWHTLENISKTEALTLEIRVKKKEL